MKTSRRDKLVPTTEAILVARRTLDLRTTGRKRNIMRECPAQMRGSIPASSRFPGRDLMWQSPLERRFIRMCVVSPSIVDAEAQPEGFFLPESDAPGAADFSSYPDATVAVRCPTGDVRPVVVECKPAVYARAAEVARRLARIGEVLARASIDYVVLTEKELPDALDVNLDLLFRAKRNSLVKGFRQLAADAMAGADCVPLGAMARRLGRVDVLSAIAQGQLHADLWSPLCDDTLVYIRPQEAHDVARVL